MFYISHKRIQQPPGHLLQNILDIVVEARHISAITDALKIKKCILQEKYM